MPAVAKRLPRSARVALLAIVAWATYVGGSKVAPPAVERIANFVYWATGGSLVDPTGVVAEYAETAAVEAFEGETAWIIAAVTGAVAGVYADAADLEGYVRSREMDMVYISADAPRDMPGSLTNHNISITQERSSVSGGVYSVWFRYSWELSDAAGISATFKIGGSLVTIAAFTNLFPAAVQINGADCYRYDFDLSSICGTNSPVVIAPYEAQFGGPAGSGIPLSTPADLEIVSGGGAVTNVGLTGWVAVPHMPPLMIRAEGGAVVEAAAYGTNYTGIVTGEVHL